MKHRSDGTAGLRVHQVQIAFTNKQLTSWGGACSVVAKFLEQICFREWVDKHVPIVESSNNARGVYSKVLSLLLTSLTGGSRFSHVTWWSHGLEGLKACFGVSWLPQSASVLTRFLAKFSWAQSESLRASAAGMVRTLIQAEGRVEDNLYLDSTVCTRYGEQEGACKGYNPRKPGRPSHHPLKAALASGYVVNLWNRRGDTHSAHQAIAFHEQTRQELDGWLKINWLLADSGFSEQAMLEHLEDQGQRYVIAARLTPCVLTAIQAISTWKKLEDGLEIAEAQISLSTWKCKRRFILVRQHIKTRPKAPGKQPMLFAELEEHCQWRYSAMITNEDTLPPETIWRTYRPRANIENTIKELKDHYGWDEFNVQNFWGTEAAMLLVGMVCYNLVHHLNRRILKTADTSLARLKTLRLRVLAIPAIYGSGGRRPTLRLGVQDRSLRGKIRYWLARIARLRLRLANCNAVGAKPGQIAQLGAEIAMN